MTTIRVGLSSCPNDTFLFAGLLQGEVDFCGLDLCFHVGDVQELNEMVVAGGLDVGKVSFATALRLSDSHGVLRVGSALGFGVGPVLLGREGATMPGPGASVLCPGAGTTATVLMQVLHPEVKTLMQRRFDQIMPALLEGEADAGVCIHEGRFTYQNYGLALLEDLGSRWEEQTGSPVPLGGLVARMGLGFEVHQRLTEVLSDSLAWARESPERALPTMRHWAQEMSDEVLWQHVDLYVNEHTADLGEKGVASLQALADGTDWGSVPPVL